MLLKNKYVVEKHWITNHVNRSRKKLMNRKFGVAHETANNDADALAHVRYFQNNNVYASYHQLVDSERIVELIPLNEIALHVRRDMDRQTLKLGHANDNAVAISLCRTGEFAIAYDRFVWAWANICVQYNWNPTKRISAHRFEDPTRRRDPQSWLEPNGIYWNTFLNDVSEYVASWESPLSITNMTNSSSKTNTRNIVEESKMIPLPNKIYKATFPYPRGSGVRSVQKALVKIHFYPDRFEKNFGIDSIYGPKTADAIRRFQKVYLPYEVDGIYGPNTRRMLLKQMN
ncbi:peptidoglycan recognition protein family protein [Salipaludibacillus daqingensis]|uniref:peptidoglycan recognition protein family protein n=1 Tax=Salipaludibacillus daqingensis TaxID=3041001 RepID=UPI0024761DEB|nr:N-acetylmuramoyl-L-alanine amidase [Salipaludibacillus daqingensis]